MSLLLSALFFALGIAIAAAQSGKDAGFHVSAVVEFYALHKYSRFKSPKAIAIGPGNRWDAYYSMRSASAAAKAALSTCNRRLRAEKSKIMQGQKCVLFDVNGKRTGQASAIGMPFGTPAAGEDRPWLYGRQWNATNPAKHGTMLLLHGCSGYFITSWQMAWVNYYRAAGFRVILPDSFADVRDPESCGNPGDLAGYDRQTRNLKLRIAQTLRTITGIRKKYPGEALYVHGHSEGGWVAQALGQKVDGIILTGTVCGFGDSGVYLAAKGVPILHIAGTKDDAFVEATSTKALTRFCRKIAGAGKVTLVSVAGMNHYAAIWWPQVQDAISKFLKAPSSKIGRASLSVAYPQIPADQSERYLKARQHKAIAADASGSWGLSTDAGSQFDAEEEALFDCDEVAGADAFLDASHMHHCVLVNVNGKRLVK